VVEYKWLLHGRTAAAQLIVNLFILVYGASFTLAMTLYQAFSTASGGGVHDGLSKLLAGSLTPEALQRLAASAYAGGFAAITCLRNEAAASVAIGVDTGKRVAAATEDWALPLLERLLLTARTVVAGSKSASFETVALCPLDDVEKAGDSEQAHPRAIPRSIDQQWLATMYAGVITSVTVLLALVFAHLTRVFSLCVLAADGLIDNVLALRACTRSPSIDTNLRSTVACGSRR
jgi:hypothetical protein